MMRTRAVSLAALVLVGCSSSEAGSTPTAGASTSAEPTTTWSTSAGATTTTESVDTVRPHEPWIVYHLYTGSIEIRLVRPDGTGDHALLPGLGVDQVHPDWSPDGSQIAYAADDSIWVVDADGTDNRRLAGCTSPCRDLDKPAWSPDGSKVAFVRIDLVDGKNPGSIVQTADVATGEVTDVFRTTGAEYANYPRWSPDGTSLVVELDRFADDDNDTFTMTGSAIGVVDIASSTVRVLTDWSIYGAYPDWNPTEDLIVFSTFDLSARDGGSFPDPSPPSDLYTIDPDGSGLTQLTHNPSGTTLVRNKTASGPLSTQPTWSPDGQSILIVQVDGTTWPGWRMGIIDADGTDLQPATGSTYQKGTHPRLRPG